MQTSMLPLTSTRSDVFTILQEIQRTWSYLEPLFIGSEEVKKELPEDAKRFETIDVDVKNILKSVSLNPTPTLTLTLVHPSLGDDTISFIIHDSRDIDHVLQS